MMIQRCPEKRVLFRESALDPGMAGIRPRGTFIAHIDQLPAGAPIAGIAEPRRSTVASIQRAVGLGLFSVAEAELMIDRIRALVTTHAAGAIPISPDWTDT
ncbi:hypothetical protein ACWGE0_06545 [Lentzea sp. NPDC054927]